MIPLNDALRELIGPSPSRYGARVVGLALAYFLAARVGFEYAVAHPVISTVWPASGIALAAILLGGLQLLPGVFIGALVANYAIEGNLTVSTVSGLGNSVEVLLGTLLLRRGLDFDVRMLRLRDVVCLIVAAATIAPLPAAQLGPSSLAVFVGLAWPEFFDASRAWWMGDSLGIVLLAQRKGFQDFVYRRVAPEGSIIFVSITGSPIFDETGTFKGYRGVGKDITAQKSAELRVARLRDFYAAMSEVNNAIIHAQDRRQLFTEVCKAIVEHGRLQFVRIAMLDPSNRQVRTVAHSGYDYGVSAQARISQ